MKAADLRKSILQYAVEGKLVKQDIQDEPASILYEKIIKEKETLIKQGKIKKEKPLPPITDNEVPYEIPDKWKWVRLGEVCEIKRGSGLTKNDFTNSGIPCIHYGQIHKYYKYSTNTTMTYTSEQVGNKLKTVEYSDIIMAITSENTDDVCKSVAWMGNFPIVTGGHTAIIKHSINPLYLIYLFNSNCFRIQKNKIAKGMKVIEISSEKLKSIIFPLPPLKEQERIVTKVDELMAICDKLEQEEEKLNKLDKHFVDTLPKSILQYAVEGKLVQQYIHDEPANIFYDKIIKEKETLVKQGKIKKEKPLPPITDDEVPYDIPENWKWVRLENISYLIGNKNNIILTKQVKETGTYPVVSQSKNLIDGFYDDKTKLIKIDMPVVIFGDHTKNVKYINFDFIIGADGTQILKPIIIDSKFLYYMILYQTFIMKDRGYARHFSLLKKAIFPLPPLKEQERIVKKVDELLTYCNKLKDII